MLLINGILKANDKRVLCFKNDIGEINVHNDYMPPSFFKECMPALSTDTVEKALDYFNEIKETEIEAYTQECYQQLLKLKEKEEE